MNCRLVMILPDKEESVHLPQGETTIGRESDNDIQISSSLISRYHARLSNYESLCEIEDLSSTNGTFVNGKRISTYRLSDEDGIRIGDMPMRFEITSSETGDDVAGVTRDYSPQSASATVRMTTHPSQQQETEGSPRRSKTEQLPKARPLRPRGENG